MAERSSTEGDADMQIMLQLTAEQAARVRGPSNIDLDTTTKTLSEKSGYAAFLFSEDVKSIDLFRGPSALQTAPFLLGMRRGD